jgi:hypothetical protein
MMKIRSDTWPICGAEIDIALPPTVASRPEDDEECQRRAQ